MCESNHITVLQGKQGKHRQHFIVRVQFITLTWGINGIYAYFNQVFLKELRVANFLFLPATILNNGAFQYRGSLRAWGKREGGNEHNYYITSHHNLLNYHIPKTSYYLIPLYSSILRIRDTKVIECLGWSTIKGTHSLNDNYFSLNH